MYHPSMWHPIPPLDMAAAFRSIRQTTSSSSPNSCTTSPEKPSLFNPAHGAFSVNTLLNQTSPDHSRMPSAHTASLNAAAAAVHHHHHLFSTLLHHYPYSAAFRPLLNGATGLLTSSTGSNSSLSSSSSSSITNAESSAFVPAGKRFKSNAHDENHCEQISPSERGSEDSFSKYSGMHAKILFLSVDFTLGDGWGGGLLMNGRETTRKINYRCLFVYPHACFLWLSQGLAKSPQTSAEDICSFSSLTVRIICYYMTNHCSDQTASTPWSLDWLIDRYLIEDTMGQPLLFFLLLISHFRASPSRFHLNNSVVDPTRTDSAHVDRLTRSETFSWIIRCRREAI